MPRDADVSTRQVSLELFSRLQYGACSPLHDTHCTLFLLLAESSSFFGVVLPTVFTVNCTLGWTFVLGSLFGRARYLQFGMTCVQSYAKYFTVSN
jgi:hypothetical protein